MIFEEALKGLRDGLAVARTEWCAKDGCFDFTLGLTNGTITAYESWPTGTFKRRWVPTQKDILAEDWSFCTVPDKKEVTNDHR